MERPTFEELLRANEEDLRRIRETYFPLISGKLITGYNIYQHLFDYSTSKLFLHYLHSDLRSNDKHFEELSKRLMIEGISLEERVVINNKLFDRREVLERDADYLTVPEWTDPVDMRYFDLKGKELSMSKAKKEKITIGESRQYDLLIRVTSMTELRLLVDLFKKYASKHLLDRKGRKVMTNRRPLENKDAVFNSFSVPLLVCKSASRKPRNLDDFLAVVQSSVNENIGGKSVIVSTLVRDKARGLYIALNERGKTVMTKRMYALRVFVEDYIENP